MVNKTNLMIWKNNIIKLKDVSLWGNL